MMKRVISLLLVTTGLSLYGLSATASPGMMTGALVGAYAACFDLDSSWTPSWAQVTAYWKLNEAGGSTNLVDSSPGGTRAATAPAAITLGATGKIGSAINFPNTNSQVSLTTLLSSGSASFSIAAWIKTSTTGQRQSIISFGDSNTNNCNQSAYLYVNASNQLAFDVACNYGPTSALTVTDGNWHHVVVVNNSGSVQLFLDGVISGSAVTLYPNIVSGFQQIGNDTGNHPFSGRIDEMAVWNTVLTGGQISTLYSNGNSGIVLSSANAPGGWANIVAYWNFDDATGTTVADRSSTGTNNGTIAGIITGVPARMGKGVSFPRSGGVTFGSPPTSGTSSFTITAWVKSTLTNQRQAILTYGYNNDSAGVYFYINGSNQLECDIPYHYGPTSVAAVADGKWHHVAVINNAGSFQLYVDGLASGSAAALSPNVTSGIQLIGNDDNPNPFKGIIDDVAVWSVALTPADIKKLRNQQSCSSL